MHDTHTHTQTPLNPSENSEYSINACAQNVRVKALAYDHRRYT